MTIGSRSARHGGSSVEIAPGVEWLDRIIGRAAVDPTYRDLLFRRPALALTGDPWRPVSSQP